MKSVLLLIALIFSLSSAWAGQQTLVTINDPSGDDHGAGNLIYPQRADFQSGDLDLLQLKISRGEEGFWFEAVFKNPIRDPGSVINGVGAESLANFARKGFYQFNLDIYVDTDRVKGSGNIQTVPGRQVRIAPEYAWDKAVILTPRPELMRQQLLDAMSEQYPDRKNTGIVASVDQSMFFPTRIQVRGKSISFFVPAAFFAGSDGSDWAITALVTAAMTTIPADLSVFPSAKTPLERLQLGVMQPVAGRPQDAFGFSGVIPGPVVDVLASAAGQQERQLSAKAGLTGVSWGVHAVDDIATAAAGEAQTGEQKPAVSNPPKRVVPIGDLLQPETSAAANPDETNPAEKRSPAESPIAKRLQTLQQLFDQKLIDEADYKLQKQRILNDL